MYQLLADMLVVGHFLFIAFVAIGGVFVIYRPRLAWLHLPSAAWGAAVELCGWFCPLTPLENYLRLSGGGKVYDGDFIEHYLLPIIYPQNLTATGQQILGILVVAVNLIFYTLAIRKHRMHKP
ncbi:MAG: DUF2784 domain-containing protein [Deltaproteobacteria bacterium HGW-Deltaproteobacteria-12]|jgi:hypothetical protein|nr:MAG: DUF2784 domain-containing protein [Deltaproteobacteria bacterium HGW-Deltaproteobacteria-12]